MDPRGQLVVVAIIAAIALVALIVHWRHQRAESPATVPTPPPPTVVVRSEPPAAAPLGGVSVGAVNMLLGNPSEATPDPKNWSNYLMVKPYFVVAYNNGTGTANWVSWRVTAADVEGSAPRKQLFDTDATLPAGFDRVTHKDYSGSGFDRGHLCPHSDRDATQEMSWATFVMTNIVPQAPNVNQGAWADFENYCRDLVRRGARLYVVAGPVGKGGTGSKGFAETIAGGRVTVPSACWKVVVVVDSSGNATDELANIGPGTRVIAIVMPNDNGPMSHDWGKYRVSVREVEKRTGFQFFNRLPADVAAALKEKVDTVPVTGAGRRGGR